MPQGHAAALLASSPFIVFEICLSLLLCIQNGHRELSHRHWALATTIVFTTALGTTQYPMSTHIISAYIGWLILQVPTATASTLALVAIACRGVFV